VGAPTAPLYNLVMTSAVMRAADFALGLAAVCLVVLWKFPPWLVVLVALSG
jgi:chromate transporter